MNTLKNNKPLGTKWFAFYTKIRPWLTCFSALTIVIDFVKYSATYLSIWWLFLSFAANMATSVLAVLTFVKAKGDYEAFIPFIKKVLLFEVFNMAYQQAVSQYVDNSYDPVYALIVFAIVLVVAYFLWYRLNVDYFTKRIDLFAGMGQTGETPRRHCSHCGNPLTENNDVCGRCGNQQ